MLSLQTIQNSRLSKALRPGFIPLLAHNGDNKSATLIRWNIFLAKLWQLKRTPLFFTARPLSMAATPPILQLRPRNSRVPQVQIHAAEQEVDIPDMLASLLPVFTLLFPQGGLSCCQCYVHWIYSKASLKKIFHFFQLNHVVSEISFFANDPDHLDGLGKTSKKRRIFYGQADRKGGGPLMPLAPLLYRYLTVLWQSSSGSKEELGIFVVGWKWLFCCKIHFRTHNIII